MFNVLSFCGASSRLCLATLGAVWTTLRSRHQAVVLVLAALLVTACSGGGGDIHSAIPSGLTYSNAAVIYQRGVEIIPNTPTTNGPAITRYSIDPPLPRGLTLDADSGVISGTPAMVTAMQTYVVTGSNASGSTQAQLQIAVQGNAEPPAGLSYLFDSVAYKVGEPITPNTSFSSAGQIRQYSVSPALPAGLSLDPQTGVISGTPTAVTAAALYTVNGSNPGGTVTGRLVLEVTTDEREPESLTYREPSGQYVVNQPINPNEPTVVGGPLHVYSVSPPLPAGLSLNAQTGVISGRPTAVTASAVYTVTGLNDAGRVQAQVSIGVLDQVTAPVTLAYFDPAPTYVAGQVIPVNEPRSEGGDITNYTVMPPLPAGLSLNAVTGEITGTPSTEQAATTYYVTGSNRVGTAQAQVTITVVAPFNGQTWQPAGTIPDGSGRYGAAATRMTGGPLDGRVLVAGGVPLGSGATVLNTAAVYDPELNGWITTGSLTTARYYAAMVSLPDGKVLIAGGAGGAGHTNPLASAEVYDPVARTWKTTENPMSNPRVGLGMVVMADGKVLAIGGGNPYGNSRLQANATNTVDVYDPQTNRWTAVRPMNEARVHPAATLLADGTVLVAGGYRGAALQSAELYDPKTDTWASIPSMAERRGWATATRLPGGSVLVTGGETSTSAAQVTVTAGAELYDPVSKTWTSAGSLKEGRYAATATLLPDGRVMIAGGGVTNGIDGALASVELYSPASNSWTELGDMSVARYDPEAVGLLDGSVLILGGANTSGGLATAERLR
ncbi:kelch repeat-containing protein [Burkholderia ubonensis]|uniref:kelch repeat-containing protein n=1 Tax=Burkholderia ubonensis TaxID=101571 RepID=UPI0009B30073|nr:kelch repeat-containing protein [Burkholderia ubonensis]